MARTTAKVSITVTLDRDLLAWVRERTGAGQEFASISHGLERGIAALIKAEKASQ